MESKARKIENSKAEIDVTASWDEIKTNYDELLKKYQKQLAIPGFRKGKAPMDIVENKIGKEVLRDAVFNAMDGAIKKAFEEVEPSLRPLPYGQPEIVDFAKLEPFEKEKDVQFTTRYEILPQFELKEYKNIEIEYPNVTISQDMIDTEIERYREQNAIIKTKDNETVEDSDLVTIDYTLEGDEPQSINDYTFTIGKKQNYYNFDNELIGMKKDETKSFTIQYTDENKPEGFTKDSATFSVTMKSIKSKELPALDDEFAQDIKSEYKTVDDLKNGIKETLEKGLENRMKNTKIHLVAQKILERNEPFDVPESMINFEINNSYSRFAQQMGMRPDDLTKFLTSQGQTKEQFTSSWRNDALENIKEQLVISKVQEMEKIEADEKKVETAKKSQIPENATDDQKSSYEAMIKDNLAYEAAIDYLIKENKLVPSKEEISYEDFASGAYLNKNAEGAN